MEGRVTQKQLIQAHSHGRSSYTETTNTDAQWLNTGGDLLD